MLVTCILYKLCGCAIVDQSVITKREMDHERVNSDVCLSHASCTCVLWRAIKSNGTIRSGLVDASASYSLSLSEFPSRSLTHTLAPSRSPPSISFYASVPRVSIGASPSVAAGSVGDAEERERQTRPGTGRNMKREGEGENQKGRDRERQSEGGEKRDRELERETKNHREKEREWQRETQTLSV
jgi:hypothetical protein